VRHSLEERRTNSRYLESHPTVGDHSIMVGEVLAVRAKPGVFDKRLRVEKEEAQTLHHLRGKEFCAPGKIVTT